MAATTKSRATDDRVRRFAASGLPESKGFFLVPHACDDGSPLRCTLARPTCGDGLLPSIRGGCWQCADPFACTARSMITPIQPVLTHGVATNNGVGTNNVFEAVRLEGFSRVTWTRTSSLVGRTRIDRAT